MCHEVRLGRRDVGSEIAEEGGRLKVQEIVFGGAHVIVGGGGPARAGPMHSGQRIFS
jgi:hypothetical protein